MNKILISVAFLRTLATKVDGPRSLSHNRRNRIMKLKTIVLAAAVALTSSLALAQPAPIGSSADFGNGAVINRGPVRTVGEAMDFKTNRSYAGPRMIVRHHRYRHWRH